MTRRITEHEVNEANSRLDVRVVDQPGSGGAHHWYSVGLQDDLPAGHPWKENGGVEILFQNGPLKESGVNGITHEVLLAIVADRLRSFQAGPFASDENREALDHVERALGWLHKRTRNRLARGVEGTHQI